MIYGHQPVAVQHIPDPSRTAGGGWVRDSNGTIWQVVDVMPARGTGDRQAVIMPDGRIKEV